MKSTAWLKVATAVLTMASPFLLAQEAGPAWQRGAELTWVPTNQIRDPSVKYHALVIGISDYARPEGAIPWKKLVNANRDARAVAGVLQDKYGFEVKTLIDQEATREAIFGTMDGLMDLGLNDAVVIYFAGHGFYDDKRGEGFWIPHDAAYKKGDRLAREDWIWNANILTMLNGSEARHILIITDACFGGSLFRGDTRPPGAQNIEWYRRAHAKPSRYLISSGDMEAVSDEGTDHSAFAEHLLKQLESPSHGVFSASDLGFAIRQGVSSETGQMVQIGALNVSTHGGGEFVFVQKGKNQEAGP